MVGVYGPCIILYSWRVRAMLAAALHRIIENNATSAPIFRQQPYTSNPIRAYRIYIKFAPYIVYGGNARLLHVRL